MRFIILIITISISMASAQNIRENIFGFATSNTFTYCDNSDTLFTNNVFISNNANSYKVLHN